MIPAAGKQGLSHEGEITPMFRDAVRLEPTVNVICGIDPGISGAVGFLTDAGTFHAVADMPVVVGSTGRKQVDGLALASLLNRFSPAFALVERVGPRPGEGAVGAFAFGHGLGVIQGVLGALSIPYGFVQPATWKRSAGIPAGAEKGASIAVARQLIPTAGDYLTLVKHHGRAESLLIARHQLATSPVSGAPEQKNFTRGRRGSRIL